MKKPEPVRAQRLELDYERRRITRIPSQCFWRDAVDVLLVVVAADALFCSLFLAWSVSGR